MLAINSNDEASACQSQPLQPKRCFNMYEDGSGCGGYTL